MRKSFKVVLDCDDVLFQCNEASITKLNSEEGTNYTINDITDWGFLGNDLDKRLSFFTDPEFMENLPIYEGAKEFVKKLSKKAEIFIMTNVAPNIAGIRINSIIKNFPEINPANIIIGGRKDLLKADIMLDDNMMNLEKACCSFPVLMRRPWNYNQTGVLSITNYDEFLKLVDIVKDNQNKDENYSAVVLIGPSGSNKNEIADKLVEKGMVRIKPYSTKENGNYTTVKKEAFYEMMSQKDFFETSSYAGNLFGTKKKDIETVIKSGKKPVLVLDINGAIAFKNEFNSLNVFVNVGKDKCIKSILRSDYSEEEKIHRILSIDSELKNEELCDLTITDESQIIKIMEEIAA